MATTSGEETRRVEDSRNGSSKLMDETCLTEEHGIGSGKLTKEYAAVRRDGGNENYGQWFELVGINKNHGVKTKQNKRLGLK